MSDTTHFSTRRGFIAASGFGGLGLYGLWAAYGAAPTPLALLGLGAHSESAPEPGTGHGGHGAAPEPEPAPAAGAHGGHGGGLDAGPDPQEFLRQTQEFAQRFALPDGRIHPRRLEAASAMAAMAHAQQSTDPAPAPADAHAGHDMPVAAPNPHNAHGASAAPASMAPDPHAGHGMADAASTPAAAPEAPIDVLMTAGKWYYFPQSLKLDVGQPYRFRMMAVDIPHGASIAFGDGSRMMRLPNGRVTEVALSFPRAGTYLMLCTLYCGEGHSLMQARIDVE
ncbi:MAG: hypothetical protein ACT4NV_16270 [Rhodoferax sp.]